MDNTKHDAAEKDSERRKPRNHLQHESSPYLLQHAHNPVDWYPWGEEAFENARTEDKPIFLSIGYATCHWCHVMAEESFADEEVAELLNRAFVCVKVDREERPDIDQIYMTACQLLTRSGGWPLTVVLTPEGKPFFAATYIPKTARWGTRGLTELIPLLEEAWLNRREEIDNSCKEICNVLGQLTNKTGDQSVDYHALNQAFNNLKQSFDEDHAGFGQQMKFPMPHNLTFLLRYWQRSGDIEALNMVERTLKAMRCGGIFDHVGFGLHRYATDNAWEVPHFEKMLYDQALFVMACTDAYLATEDPVHRTTAEQTLTYVLRDMRDADYGFFSAEDADTDGVEGAFYTWTRQELEGVLNKNEQQWFDTLFKTAPLENPRATKPHAESPPLVISLRNDVNQIARLNGLSVDSVQGHWEEMRQKLFNTRNKRSHPFVDDKKLAAWNGLMIKALAEAAAAFNDATYLEVAENAAAFVKAKMMTANHRLCHYVRKGKATGTPFLDDYAFIIGGFIALYRVTLHPHYLKRACQLHKTQLELFWDNDHHGFFYVAKDSEQLLVRSKEITDGALPSGNSMALQNLMQLAYLTGDPSLEERAVASLKAFSGQILHAPEAHTFTLGAADLSLGATAQVVLVGDRDQPDTQELHAALLCRYLPKTLIINKPLNNEKDDICQMPRFLQDYTRINNTATAYVCRNQTCTQPTTDTMQMLNNLYDISTP